MCEPATTITGLDFDNCLSCFAAEVVPSVAPTVRRRKSKGRSFHGCITCRRRHVRCDETKPFCTRCTKRGTQCEGYSPFRIHPGLARKMNTPRALVRPQDVFTAQFVSKVASILIVYDSTYNKNPFRSILPSLTSDEDSLHLAMQALGALHLSRTEPDGPDKGSALIQYNLAVKQLRLELSQPLTLKGKMCCMASSLLLCFYEINDADGKYWRTHLVGAKQLFERLVKECQDRYFGRDERLNFLVSLFAYLDVSAAVATGEGTQVEGRYWEQYGDGWDYNLGLSMNESEPPGLNVFRAEFSELMDIMAKLSLLHSGRDRAGTEAVELQLQRWHEKFPNLMMEDILRQRQEELDLEPGFLNREETMFRESAVATYSYGQACIVHLHRVKSEEFPPPPHVLLAINRVLLALSATPRDPDVAIVHIGMLWAVFTVGLELADADSQRLVHDYLCNLRQFGLGNVENAIEFLDDVWRNRRFNPFYTVDIVCVARQRGTYLLLP